MMTNYYALTMRRLWSTHIGSYIACVIMWTLIFIMVALDFIIVLSQMFWQDIRWVKSYFNGFLENNPHTPKHIREIAKQNLKEVSRDDKL